MTADLPIPAQDGPDLTAAEYVLGVLPLSDRIAVEARLKTDPALAAAVLLWQARLHPLNDETAAVQPSASLLPQIEARLFPAAPRKRWFSPLWAGASTALAALLVAAFFFTSPPKPLFTASLAANASTVSYLVEVSDAGISLTLSGPAPLATQTHQLWLIAGDAAPVSLGLISATPLPLPAALQPGMILAVSLEPAGGSPTGLPTGPVLALGPLEQI